MQFHEACLYSVGMTAACRGDGMSQPAIREYLKGVVGASPSGPADLELLARFAETRDESAFELLVWRHAALVQRVCRTVLRDHHAAEDAAQAAFLVLARKAHTFGARGSVVGWLYRVARRIAVRMAKDRVRRPMSSESLEHVAGLPSTPALPLDELEALCAEVDRLPERYRVPILFCFFEGLTHAEAARRIGWPVGSVAGRVARAKQILARRLSRKGIGLAGVVLAVPAGSFVGATAQASRAFAARAAVIPGVDPSVTRIAEGALKTMTATTWKLTAAVAIAACTLTAGVWSYAASQPATPVLVPESGVAQVEAPATPVATLPAAEPDDNTRTADARQRAQSSNNLKQILIAIHNYHDANGHLPANVTDADGKPLLSWRVLLLPYLDHDALYRKFKLDEPWDSENNKKLLAQMPDMYKLSRAMKDATKTYYQGFAGPGTLFEPGKKLSIATISDGTSNTLAVVEAGPAVEWTKPADIPFDPKKDLPKLEGPFTNVLMAAAGDGAAYALQRGIDAESLRRMIQRDDGLVVSIGDFKAKFPLTKDEVKEAHDLLAKNEKLFHAISEQLREQQGLLIAAMKKKPDGVIQDLRLDRLAQMNVGLEAILKEIKAETETLRKEIEGKK